MTTTHKPKSHTSNQPLIGVLLVHGFNGSKNDMAGLQAFLQEHGIVTENMVLPGHGRHVRELLPLGWQDWSDAVLEELRALKQRCEVVFLVGHSLGGALALHAAAHEEVAGIVTMCAPIYMQPWMRPIGTGRWASAGVSTASKRSSHATSPRATDSSRPCEIR